MKKFKKALYTGLLSTVIAVSGLVLFKTDAYAVDGARLWKEWDTYYQHLPDGDYSSYLVAGENGTVYSTNTPGHFYDFPMSYPSDRRFKHRFELQKDGNLVLYRHVFSDNNNGQAVWASHTAGSGANRFVVQSDGNMVLYRPDGVAVWASNTQYINNGAAWTILLLQGDGNLVMYNYYYNQNQGWYVVPVWATGTNG